MSSVLEVGERVDEEDSPVSRLSVSCSSAGYESVMFSRVCKRGSFEIGLLFCDTLGQFKGVTKQVFSWMDSADDPRDDAE